jgi:hypothetical protein
MELQDFPTDLGYQHFTILTSSNLYTCVMTPDFLNAGYDVTQIPTEGRHPDEILYYCFVLPCCAFYHL